MKLIDYKCSFNDGEIDMVLDVESKLNFPEVHHNSEDMVLLSKLIKAKYNDNFCILPFCHTLEAEALGGIINLGDEKNGPRVKEYVCNSVEDVLQLPAIDFSKGRIHQVLKASKELSAQGEEVIFFMSGPFTILNTLIKPTKLFKTFKKEPEIMQTIFNKIQKQLLDLTIEVKRSGVKIISYADSSGGLNILGPNFFEKTLEMFTVDTLDQMSEIMGSEGLIQLCPKTSLGLISSGRAKWGFLKLDSNMNYRKSITKFKGKARFIGETCLKNPDYMFENKQLKTIILKDQHV